MFIRLTSVFIRGFWRKPPHSLLINLDSEPCAGRAVYAARDFMSMTKRYLTSLRSMRS